MPPSNESPDSLRNQLPGGWTLDSQPVHVCQNKACECSRYGKGGLGHSLLAISSHRLAADPKMVCLHVDVARIYLDNGLARMLASRCQDLSKMSRRNQMEEQAGAWVEDLSKANAELTGS